MINPIQFDPGLWRGPAPQTMQDLAELERIGISTVINLERRPTLVTEIPIRTLWFPLGQIFPPLRFRVAAAINAMLGARFSDRQVYVCCRHGKDRTGFLVATYRVVFRGWMKGQARAEMARHQGASWLAFWRAFVR